MAYSIYTKYKKKKTGLINIEFSKEGSVYFTDLIGRHFKTPEFSFFTYDFPPGKVGTGKQIKPDSIAYVTTGKPKFSYHPRDKVFQVSGDCVFSRINKETKEPEGLGMKIFDFNIPHNDGGPIVTGLFWGLNHLEEKVPKSSEEILFDEDTIRYQNLNNKGQVRAFAVLIFQLTEEKIRFDEEGSDWGYYDYLDYYKKPLRVRILRNPYAKGYVLAISVLNARSDNDSETGFHLSGGSTMIDPKTGMCKDVALIFPKPNIGNGFSEVPLNYLKET